MDKTFTTYNAGLEKYITVDDVKQFLLSNGFVWDGIITKVGIAQECFKYIFSKKS